ncbi:MAG: RNA-binding S4 domain-containing protein [Rhodospirillaceae bacterium]|nr:RNA-binding S4 domain-containing protein [Rhodospirillaceae bacterium]
MSGESLRLDKWLWYARFAKTRAMTQKLIERGQVTVNGAQVLKTSAQVDAGDIVAVVLGPVRRTVIVRDTGERRGSPTEARMLYEEPAPPERLSWEDAGLPLHTSGR